MEKESSIKKLQERIARLEEEKKEKMQKYSNITSVSTFILLSIISLGIYEIVWFYRNWKFFKEKENLDISPFWRAIFAIFFINSLFKKMLESARKQGYKEDYSSGWRTFFWFILTLMSRAENFVFLFSVLTFLPLIKPLNAVNFYYKTTERNCIKRSFKWWQVILIILAIGCWILILIGLFAPINEETTNPITTQPITGELNSNYIQFMPFSDQYITNEINLEFNSNLPINVYFVPTEEDYNKFMASQFYNVYQGCSFEGKTSEIISCSVSSGGIIIQNPNSQDITYTILAKAKL